jgi:hypothetical protein
LFIVGQVCLTLFYHIYIAYGYGVLPFTFVNHNALMIGSALEVFFFSLALNAKVARLRKEKIAAEEQQSALAEEKRGPA